MTREQGVQILKESVKATSIWYDEGSKSKGATAEFRIAAESLKVSNMMSRSIGALVRKGADITEVTFGKGDFDYSLKVCYGDRNIEPIAVSVNVAKHTHYLTKEEERKVVDEVSEEATALRKLLTRICIR